ncbi:phosphoribosyltransferase domain-containing protein [Rhodoferax sp. 4810]|uniref:Phosphoribosyltransferase domain-containing protein n=1 Tax=Thiospirillum jenense TaxID=1653858 RepID=A0A839H5U3_9GAMM|nr:phosphoribosyltransferase domain-containing protein [Thiospirillum jenense]MBB1073043.1 phosphoribosyltransferase domain-containing protein [Rhodoferax jenense]MBB1124991.1 phosphoribosyltransferase domain-containing protein [Thiospirillum jenense]
MPIEQHDIELLTGRLSVTVYDADWPLNTLCGFAARANPKRGFLFVSKVLGKHLPSSPNQMQQLHELLAAKLTDLQQPCLFIALAETATGLGQGIFEAALNQQPNLQALFIHSTRYLLPERPHFAFQEPHCHAPTHFLYQPITPPHLRLFNNARELVIIDDEISTGTTLFNLINLYRTHNSCLTRITCVTITNFSGLDTAEHWSNQLGLPVRFVTALSGEFRFQPTLHQPYQFAPNATGYDAQQDQAIAQHYGRFGINRAVILSDTELNLLTADLPPNTAVLLLGTGEFMHMAFRLGLALEQRGYVVSIQATTRSPILIGAAIQRRLIFADNYSEGIPNYLYNVDPTQYTRIIICHETLSSAIQPLIQQLGTKCVNYSVLT